MNPVIHLLLAVMVPVPMLIASPPPTESVGSGSYYQSIPSPQSGPSDTAGNAVTPRITPEFHDAVPTNTWWSSLIWERSPGNTFGQVLHPHPLSAQADASGLRIGQVNSASPTGAGYGYHFTPAQHALTISAVGLAADEVRVADASDWTVTASWSDGIRTLAAQLGRGLPTVHATVTGGTPIVLVNPSSGGAADVEHSGNRIVLDAADASWALYALDGGSWIAEAQSFRAVNTSRIAVAVLPDRAPATLDRFDHAAPVRVVDTRVSWDWNPGRRTVDVTYAFITDTDLPPLVCLYGHQLDHLEEDDLESWGTYATARGDMTLTGTSSFTAAFRCPPLLPLLADTGTVDPSRIDSLLETDLADDTFPPDTYWFGKAAGRLAQLALIADQQGRTDLRNQAVATLREQLESWLTVDSSNGLEAADRLQAERADDLHGVAIDPVPGADESAVTGFGGGDWIRLPGVAFGDGLPLRAVVRLASDTDGSGLLSIRIDAVDGPVIAEAGIGTTGGWTTWTDVALGIIPTDPSVLAGTHDLYITCETPYSSDIFSLDWITFDYGGSAVTDQYFAYDPTWSTLIGFPASYGADTELNDHHFHYGYFIMAAAVIARFDPEWAALDRWGGMINLLIRDAANWERDDDRFCFLRHFEPYVGYSYAAGHAGFAAGNNQESSSESLNFAAACVLWGLHTNQEDISDLGLFLLAVESAAVEAYWFDVNQSVFPESMPHPLAGIVWDSGADYATWWTANQEEIHGINILPVTGASLYLGRRSDAVTRSWNHLVSQNGGEPTVWQDILWSYLGLADADAAWQRLHDSPDYWPESGDSRTRTYHWLAALRGLGRVAEDITGDHPLSAVFRSDSGTTYVAHNPGPAPIQVTFSDGRRLCVTAGATQYAHTNQDGDCPLDSDFDGDGMVAVDDLLKLLGAWGPCPDCPEDLTGDGEVTVDDLLILLEDWTD